MEDKRYWDRNWQKWEKVSRPSLFAVSCLPEFKKRHCLQILELGCGTGADALFFAENGMCVTAADISETALSSFGHPRITKVCADIASFDFSARFDAVFANLSLHYFDDETTRRIFCGIFGVLKAGGVFCARCKSVKDPLFGKGECLAPNIYRLEHVRRFFDEEYARSLISRFSSAAVSETFGDYFGPCAFIDIVAVK